MRKAPFGSILFGSSLPPYRGFSMHKQLFLNKIIHIFLTRFNRLSSLEQTLFSHRVCEDGLFFLGVRLHHKIYAVREEIISWRKMAVY
jgi:hypothetical protein